MSRQILLRWQAEAIAAQAQAIARTISAGKASALGEVAAALARAGRIRLRADAAWRRLGAAPPRPGFCHVPAGRLDDLSLPGAILALPPRTLAARQAPLPLSEPDETEAAWTGRTARRRGR